jgi:transposase
VDHFAGLDVSVKATSVCIMDDTDKIVRENKTDRKLDATASASS